MQLNLALWDFQDDDALFVSVDDPQTGIALLIGEDKWEDMGEPDKITVEVKW